MAVAVSLTPVYSAAVTRLRERLPFYENRPKLNRTMALFLISLLCNVVGTAAFAFAGAWIASLVTGVPMFPPGYFAS